MKQLTSNSAVSWVKVDVLRKIKISRTFLHAKQVGEKRGKFQLVVIIALKAVILILLCL